MQDYNTSKVAGTPVTFEVRQNNRLIDTQTISLGSGGSYTLELSVTGLVEVRAKASHWLAQWQLVEIPGIANFSLPNGDITNDNAVNVLDYAQMKASYNKINVGNHPADLNGDYNINVLDYLLLKKNYNKLGE